MTDIDKARAQRDALRNVARRTVGGTSRAEQALQRYLNVGLYEAHHDHDKKVSGDASDDKPADEASQ